jgi:fucose permease|tara:strand:+ start:1631 stop:1870 length:240 start_codon:yes stop_codon:yes gene_type:complete
MAISEGAIIPPLYGRLVDANKQELIAIGINDSDALATAAISSYWILIPCYAFILFFAIGGINTKAGIDHKIGLHPVIIN